VREEVEEDKYTSASTEGDMDTARLDTEAFAHGSLELEDIEQLLALEEVMLSAAIFIVRWRRQS